MEEGLGQEPRHQDDAQHAGSDCEHDEMLAKMEATWDAFTMSLRDTKKISLIKKEDRQFKLDLRESLRDARLRMVTW